VQEGVTTIEEVLSVTTVHELMATAPVQSATGPEAAPTLTRVPQPKR
jgi:hypothetical protein